MLIWQKNLYMETLNNTSILQEITSSLNYETTGENRLVTVLYKKVEEMEKELHDLRTKKVIEETQFPQEVLEQNGLLPLVKKRFKSGKGYRPILQSEIEEAKKHSPFAAGQARWLGVHKCTYKKYAKRYGIYEPSPNRKGVHTPHDPNIGKYPLFKILNGDFNGVPAISNWMVRDKLIRSGTVLPKCNICGYDKRRIADNKLALLLDHKDGDLTNWKKDNLQLLCFNCTFECGRGYIRRGNHMFKFDPDLMDGITYNDLRASSRFRS